MLSGGTATGRRSRVEAIAVGASAGGVAAVQRLLPAIALPDGPPVMVVVHIPQRGGTLLSRVFGRDCAVPVREALDKQAIARGSVWLAPAGYHLLVESTRHFALSVDELVNGSRPSIDVLFESAADAYGRALVAIVLTGANSDGALGARSVRDKGGLVVVQEPGDAESPRMPTAAIACADPQFIGPLDAIAGYVHERVKEAP